MTLEEQIELFESNAEFERKEGDLQGCLNFRQLANWLKDYKRLLEQEPCGYAISRQVVLDMLENINAETEGVGFYYEHYVEYIKNLPPVSPQPKEGYWEWNQYDSNPKIGNFHCSLCHIIGRAYYDYCPGCGAKMSEIPTGAEGSEE